jgi:hypothetical protein
MFREAWGGAPAFNSTPTMGMHFALGHALLIIPRSMLGDGQAANQA